MSRVQRAKHYWELGVRPIPDVIPGWFRVPRGTTDGEPYYINVLNRRGPSCTCMDWVINMPRVFPKPYRCWHIELCHFFSSSSIEKKLREKRR